MGQQRSGCLEATPQKPTPAQGTPGPDRASSDINGYLGEEITQTAQASDNSIRRKIWRTREGKIHPVVGLFTVVHLGGEMQY